MSSLQESRRELMVQLEGLMKLLKVPPHSGQENTWEKNVILEWTVILPPLEGVTLFSVQHLTCFLFSHTFFSLQIRVDSCFRHLFSLLFLSPSFLFLRLCSVLAGWGAETSCECVFYSAWEGIYCVISQTKKSQCKKTQINM